MFAFSWTNWTTGMTRLGSLHYAAQFSNFFCDVINIIFKPASRTLWGFFSSWFVSKLSNYLLLLLNFSHLIRQSHKWTVVKSRIFTQFCILISRWKGVPCSLLAVQFLLHLIVHETSLHAELLAFGTCNSITDVPKGFTISLKTKPDQKWVSTLSRSLIFPPLVKCRPLFVRLSRRWEQSISLSAQRHRLPLSSFQTMLTIFPQTRHVPILLLFASVLLRTETVGRFTFLGRKCRRGLRSLWHTLIPG